jgi:hypothetical protein
MNLRSIGFAFVIALATAAALNYVPGLTDAQGRAFGIFALDIYDDLLHFASALWALAATLISRDALVKFFKIFGTLYFLDGLMGLAVGSGFLDLGIVFYGVQPMPFGFKILANLPHLLLGGVAMLAGFVLAGRART